MTETATAAVRRLDGTRAIITGAATGIGAATARRLAAEGAGLFLVDLAADALEVTAEACRADGTSAHTRVVDVADDVAVDEAVAAAADVLGGIDAMVNVAGLQRWAHTHEHTTEDYRLTIDVNLGGTFFFCRAAIAHLLESGGCIVNTASTTSFAGLPYSVVYAASKAGVLMLTKSLAVEYTGRGVRANCVAPGSIDTVMGRPAFPDGVDLNLLMRQASLQGIGQPDDVASVIAMLISDDGRHINGECIVVDGAAIA